MIAAWLETVNKCILSKIVPSFGDLETAVILVASKCLVLIFASDGYMRDGNRIKQL